MLPVPAVVADWPIAVLSAPPANTPGEDAWPPMAMASAPVATAWSPIAVSEPAPMAVA
jgi:hypothetical protein